MCRPRRRRCSTSAVEPAPWPDGSLLAGSGWTASRGVISHRGRRASDWPAPRVYECRFEEFDARGPYDVVLFCESLQYVRLAESLRRTVELLRPGGRLVLADFFRTDATGYSPLAGGHRLRDFHAEIARHPLVCRTDLDITRQTAPTVAIMNETMVNAVRPIWEVTQQYLNSNHPWLSRILHWALRRRLAKLEKKQFAGQATPEAFARFKSYRIMVYEKQ